MKLLLVWSFLLCGVTFAQPVISNITIDNLSHTSLSVKYNISPDSYCQVKYGLSSGNYLWASESFPSNLNNLSGFCWVPINGLAEGTTYYFLPTARPDPDDDTNICSASGCGSSEISATTTAGAVPHLPAMPAAVARWVSSYPNTASNYVTITLADGGPAVNDECVAASAVSAPAGYSWTIAAGTTFENIVSTVGFGTIIEVPEGVTCLVKPNANGNAGNHGYIWPDQAVDPLATSIDDPNHRWIIVRTQEANAGDLPPFGYRAGPQFSANYGAFKATAVSTGALFVGGTIWQTLNDSYGQNHHLWFSNLKFEVDETQTTASWDSFMRLGTTAATPAPILPAYIVVDRCWFHAPSRSGVNALTPYVTSAIYGAITEQFAFVGNYFDNFTFGGSVGIPQPLYLVDGTGGPFLFDNNYCGELAMCQIIETNSPNQPNWPHDGTVTHNTYYWPISTLPFATWASQTQGGYGCRNNFETKGTDKLLISGNTFFGDWSCGNSGMPILLMGEIRDVTIRSNLIHRAAMVLGINGQGNGVNTIGLRFPAARILFENNLAYDLGRANYNGWGPGIDSGYVEVATPANDITIRRNTLGPIASTNVWYVPQVAFAGYGMGTVANFQWDSNLFHFSIGSNVSSGGIFAGFGVGGPAGIFSHPPAPIPYSLTSPNGDYTAILGMNSTKADGASGLGISDVIVNQPGSGYANGGNVSFGGCSSPPAATYGVNGSGVNAITFSGFGSGCIPSSYHATAVGGSGAILTPYYSGSPSYFWGNNVGICTTSALLDMDPNTCATLTATMPPGNVFVSGVNTAARQANAGLLGIANNDYTCTATAESDCHAGVVMSELESELGIVSQVNHAASAAAVLVSYMAPDSRACNVDLSANGTNWTRLPDGGGPRIRTVVFRSGVSASTPYQYRVLCYYPQDPTDSPWFEFPADASNLNTTGTVTTLPAGLGNPLFPFILSGASSYKVTLTAIDGTQYTNTCTTSPCVVPGVPVGDYSAVWQYLNGSIVTRSSSAQTVGVR